MGEEILTGSWRSSSQLEVWDFRSGRRIGEVKWRSGDKDCSIYAAQFSKEGNGRYILAGGSGANEARVFDHKSNDILVGAPIGCGDSTIVSVDFCEAQPSMFAVATKASAIHLYDVVDLKTSHK